MLSNINTSISDVMGPFGLIIILGALGIILVLITVVMMVNQPEDPLDKLKRDRTAPRKGDGQIATLRQKEGNAQLQKYATFLEPKDEGELSQKQLELRQAGYQSRDAVRMFYFAQMSLGLIGLFIGVVYTNLIVEVEMTTQKTVMWTLGPGAIGYWLPKYWITRRVAARKEQIEQGFPDALDMMLVCVEAGQSLDQCIVRVGNELKASYAALADEFEVVAQEMKAGKDKVNVLNDMGTRCGVQDISSFVTVLVQSAAFGTSIADALRVYAAEMRDKRVMKAEEAANKLPTKMTLATMMFTVPPLLIILVGPSVMGITKMSEMGGPGQ
ncbi:type II secretion system F family protein [Sulfitobacter guttiformis]|uniref:Type II secretion system protein F (GspF) n=1 Tax=Sulfitobacter guttiformis TaxID=74349 RepID=A0A420DPA1_9RHOB|nr:type II secretion system F family protein [Sulfitobacter guttiformis]KIN73401.1 Type II/IV secretion system protein, TadC subfamily [Sulfitobacter guttiformis KCTC 32187]RKE96062.1 type II secretion system protein F (GspF) [Sulfitobacter guttiformis]